MKKYSFLFVALVAVLAGCGLYAPVAQESGVEDRAYLLFVSNKTYANKEVQVTLDNTTPFTAKVVKAKKASRRGNQYGINPGTRKLKVELEGQVLYEKTIVLSSQEVKQILLP